MKCVVAKVVGQAAADSGAVVGKREVGELNLPASPHQGRA